MSHVNFKCVPQQNDVCGVFAMALFTLLVLGIHEIQLKTPLRKSVCLSFSVYRIYTQVNSCFSDKNLMNVFTDTVNIIICWD